MLQLISIVKIIGGSVLAAGDGETCFVLEVDISTVSVNSDSMTSTVWLPWGSLV
jgi:hypothetical protein